MVEIFVYFAIKLWPIVSYNQLRYSKPIDNILPHELDDVLVFDGGEGLSLYPFSKVVSGNQQWLFLSWGGRQWSNYINSMTPQNPGVR